MTSLALHIERAVRQQDRYEKSSHAARSVAGRFPILVHPRVSTRGEWRAWLNENARYRCAVAGGIVGFEDTTDAAAFKLMFG